MRLNPINITPFHFSSLGVGLSQALTRLDQATSQTWPSANRVVGYPFYVEYPFLINTVFAYFGATLAGNFVVAVLSHDFTVLVASASTAMSTGTINTIKTVSVTPTMLAGNSNYHLVLGSDSGTSTYFGGAMNANRGRMYGCWDADSAYSSLTAGTAITPTQLATTTAYVFGISQGSVV